MDISSLYPSFQDAHTPGAANDAGGFIAYQANYSCTTNRTLRRPLRVVVSCRSTTCIQDFKTRHAIMSRVTVNARGQM